ncbi:MAG: type II toxin-antitoxin system RelE/ParE family toxin [Pirellulales bacterium]|nr:type II toxin-antitoxin system RelE/ParE family toxin [Pirellulales bacterium]
MAVYREVDDDLVAQGVWGEVRHAIRASGEMEAKDWLDDANNAAFVAKFDHLFRKVRAGQRITNEQHFRHLSKHIWEFKRDANRLLCFQDGRCWRLTHHFPKKSRKCPPKQIERANRIRDEHLARQASKGE